MQFSTYRMHYFSVLNPLSPVRCGRDFICDFQIILWIDILSHLSRTVAIWITQNTIHDKSTSIYSFQKHEFSPIYVNAFGVMVPLYYSTQLCLNWQGMTLMEYLSYFIAFPASTIWRWFPILICLIWSSHWKCWHIYDFKMVIMRWNTNILSVVQREIDQLITCIWCGK